MAPDATRAARDETMSLRGRRVLVVEDDALIAMMAEDMLAELGCQVVGVALGLAEAMDLADSQTDLDVALLDVNLSGQSAHPLADRLRARGVMVVFATGYGDLPPGVADAAEVVLRKPYRAEDLATAMEAALRGR
jgi:CheY-like chemotaxis protein